jgi:hypothetical protein
MEDFNISQCSLREVLDNPFKGPYFNSRIDDTLLVWADETEFSKRKTLKK